MTFECEVTPPTVDVVISYAEGLVCLDKARMQIRAIKKDVDNKINIYGEDGGKPINN